MDMSQKIYTQPHRRSCRPVVSGRYLENREIYMAQSKLTKNGQRADPPSLEQAYKINRGIA